AEDGIRDDLVTGVQTCALPIWLELVPAKRQFQVFVDYAHTPDALGNVLKTLRELQPNQLIAVFGCGGNRDRQKRPLMAEMADRQIGRASCRKEGRAGWATDDQA